MSEQLTQYQRDFIRMLDSMREEHKGEATCLGVEAKDCENCLLTNFCENDILFNAEKIIEIVTQWAKEHPFVTYEQKYEETFGVKPVTEHGDYYCPCMTGYKCPHIDTNTLKSSVGCEDCKEQFWKSEYKLPKKESEVDGKTD